jgi:transcriptional regulator with XRE-family HTH domain
MARQGNPADLRLMVVFLRSLRRWTQEGLSKATGVDRGLISDYELGKKAPTRRTLERLAAGVGLPYGYVESLLPLFRSARRAVEGRPTGGEPEESEPGENFVEETARSIGEQLRVALTPFLIELEAMIEREEGDERPEGAQF